MKKIITKTAALTIGVDLGDKHSEVCGMNQAGEVEFRRTVVTSAEGLRRFFGRMKPCRVAIEVGVHSPWAKRVLESCGHEVLVANARRVRAIYENPTKSDRVDAEWLARLARVDPKLLSPIYHRSPGRQRHLGLLRTRDALVRARTLLINHVRGAVKTTGGRLPSCSAAAFVKRVRARIVEELLAAMNPILESLEQITVQIRALEKMIAEVARAHYPEVGAVGQPSGVGMLTAMRFVLTIEDPSRFRSNRLVGPYVGLTPRRDQSGSSDRQMHITKAGDSDLRRCLVTSAQYILGPFGPDCDLRRFGKALSERGGRNSKKRAIVAVARRLAVLLLSLWRTGEEYEPLRLAGMKQIPA